MISSSVTNFFRWSISFCQPFVADAHAGGLSQSFALPFATAANRPGQDAGPFGPQLVGQVTDRARRRNLDVERNDAHPTPKRGVGAADPGPVVGDQPQLELGGETRRNFAA